MENQIMVSVICNVFNHEKYVRDALEGFVMQKTTFPFEVLVHDDASTDKSAEIIREYEEKYPEIIKPIYQTENQFTRGGKITRRFQIPRIRGKYVAPCEGDDYWTDPLKLQKQFDFMEANPEYSMCACSTVWLDMRTGKRLNKCQTKVDRDVSLEELILREKGRVFQYATFLVKREVFVELPDWATLFKVGDTPLEMRAAINGKVRMLADIMAVYRNNAPGSWTNRAEKNVNFKSAAFQNVIAGLTAFNEATEYRYNDTIITRIKRINYDIARANRDLKALRSGELKEVYRSKRFLARMSDVLYCKCIPLYRLTMKILGKAA